MRHLTICIFFARHCSGGFWTLFMGVTSMWMAKQEGRQVHVTRGGVRHPQYDSQLIINDLGLIQLMSEVEIDSELNLVCVDSCLKRSHSPAQG